MSVSVSRKALCAVYAFLAVVGLAGTWLQNVKYLQMHLGFWGFQRYFYQQSLINPAGRANFIDMYVFGVAVFIWMVMEARRLRMRFIWLYPLAFLLIGISTFVPIFFINRQRALAAQEGGDAAGTITGVDVAGLVLSVLGVAALAVALLMQTWG